MRIMVASALAAVLLGLGSAAPTPSGGGVAAVCSASSNTVEDGLGRFIGELQKVTDAAGKGDLAGAEKSVRDAGTVLVKIGADLRTDAAKADSAELRTALTELAAEFEKQGAALSSLSALQGFDTKRMEALADRMTILCGAARPSPTRTA
jgi:hypothetical protein